MSVWWLMLLLWLLFIQVIRFISSVMTNIKKRRASRTLTFAYPVCFRDLAMLYQGNMV